MKNMVYVNIADNTCKRGSITMMHISWISSELQHQVFMSTHSATHPFWLDMRSCVAI